MNWKRKLRKNMTSGRRISLSLVTGVAAGAVARRMWDDAHTFPLAGKVVLITGGSRGLGFALAEQFLRRGCRVALCARDAVELDSAERRLSSCGEVFTWVCDLRQRAEITAMMAAVRARLGPVDVLVNNAGVMHVGPWQDMTEADFEEAMKVHFWAPLWTALEALPDMIERRAGRIVNVSSIGGIIGVPHMLPYAASKFALTGLSEAWRAELMRYGIRMTLVCPWLMRTGSQEQALFKGKNQYEFAWFALSGATPLSAMDAGRAARRVVHACRWGEARVVLSLPGRMAALVHGVAPSVVNNLMGVVSRLLPEPGGIECERRTGADSYNTWTARLLRPMIRRAGERFNQPRVA